MVGVEFPKSLSTSQPYSTLNFIQILCRLAPYPVHIELAGAGADSERCLEGWGEGGALSTAVDWGEGGGGITPPGRGSGPRSGAAIVYHKTSKRPAGWVGPDNTSTP